VYNNFMSLRNQIYTEATGSRMGGHAVNLMGYGVDAGTKYWLVQNSWGTDGWGNNGFGRVLRGTNLVGIETEAYVTRVWVQGGTPAPCIDSNDGTGLSSDGHPPYIPCSQALGGNYGNLCTRSTVARRCMSTCSRCDGTDGANAPPSPPTPGQAPAPPPSFSPGAQAPTPATTPAPTPATTPAATTPAATTAAPTPSPTEPPSAPSGNPSCQDRDPSGIKLNGIMKKCAQLQRFCRNYAFVRRKCPETCGECNVSVSCADDPNYSDPHWHQKCSSWAPYSCKGFSFSQALQTKCPKACNVC